MINNINNSENQNLEFLDALSLASSIVWFKSIGESEKNMAHIMKEIDFNHTYMIELEKKLDKILELLEK